MKSMEKFGALKYSSDKDSTLFNFALISLFYIFVANYINIFNYFLCVILVMTDAHGGWFNLHDKEQVN